MTHYERLKIFLHKIRDRCNRQLNTPDQNLMSSKSRVDQSISRFDSKKKDLNLFESF